MGHISTFDTISFQYAFSDGHKGTFSGTVKHVMHPQGDKSKSVVVELDEPYKGYREVLVNLWWSKAEKTGVSDDTTQARNPLNFNVLVGDTIKYRHKLTHENMVKTGVVEYVVNGGGEAKDISGVVVRTTDINGASTQEYFILNNMIITS